MPRHTEGSPRTVDARVPFRSPRHVMRARFWRSLALVSLVALMLAGACRKADAPPPHPPQTSGRLTVPGLLAPVRVVRDAAGVPHITAANQDDLFFAQGFVQAQDRLFQMDLWKRAAQGRLSEVLGANFIQRDSMTRRIQFRGDYAKEWASYGPDTERIATAFINGINAWVRVARQDVPEDFVAAGWLPEFWKPEDLLNRTDAYLASTGALDDLFRASLVASVGAERAAALFPPADRQRLQPDPSVDLSAITYVVADALKRIGTPPFFLTIGGKVSAAPRPGQAAPEGEPLTASAGDVGTPSPPLRASGHLWIVEPGASDAHAPLVAVSENGTLSAPAARYLVHLTAPGWDVIGATSPWRPGVAMGHNAQVAWAMLPAAVDTADVFVERVNPQDPRQVERDGRWVDVLSDSERVFVKGRERPPEHERQTTPSGVVIAQDKERHLLYTLRWSGMEYGGAGELAALSLNRASSADEFRQALSHWKAPVSDFIYADRSGQVGRSRAGLIPKRGLGNGLLPVRAWASATKWTGFDDSVRPQELEPAFADGSVEAIRRAQASTSSPSAHALLAMIDQIRASDKPIEGVRSRLDSWDGVYGGQHLADARLLEQVERLLRGELAARAGVPDAVRADVADRVRVSALMGAPNRAWFGQDPKKERDRMLLAALEAVSGDESGQKPENGGLVFSHPLAVFDEAKRRFDVGPVVPRGAFDSVQALSGQKGTAMRLVFDLADWNRSAFLNPPGQSGSPASPRYDDQLRQWTKDELIPLVFDQSKLADGQVERLELVPR